MNQPLANTRVVISFPWQGDGTTGPKVFEVFINDIAMAIKTNANNQEVLEEIRKTLLFLGIEVERMIAEAKYPELMRQSKPLEVLS